MRRWFLRHRRLVGDLHRSRRAGLLACRQQAAAKDWLALGHPLAVARDSRALGCRRLALGCYPLGLALGPLAPGSMKPFGGCRQGDS
jgi:hypothetical protein